MKRLVATGKYDLTVVDSKGNVRQHVNKSNRVVNTGLAMIASLIAGPDKDPNYISRPTHNAIGSIQNDVNPTDTKLIGEVFRKSCDSIVRTNNAIEFTTTYLPGEPDLERVRICETGLYNAETDGTLFNRCVFSQINKYRDDTLIVKYNLTINAQDTVYDDVDHVPDETPPTTTTMVTVTINQPANGRITVTANDTPHQMTFQVEAGTVIQIVCAPNKGYQVDQLLYGGTTIISGARRNIASDVTISATISEIPVETHRVTIIQPSNGLIIANDGIVDYTSTLIVDDQTKLSFRVQPIDGYQLRTLTLNNNPIKENEQITITNNSLVSAVLEQIDQDDGNRVVTIEHNEGGLVLINDGSEDHATEFICPPNTQLRVRVVPEQGYQLQSLVYWYWGSTAPDDIIGDQIVIENNQYIQATHSLTVQAVFDQL